MINLFITCPSLPLAFPIPWISWLIAKKKTFTKWLDNKFNNKQKGRECKFKDREYKIPWFGVLKRWMLKYFNMFLCYFIFYLFELKKFLTFFFLIVSLKCKLLFHTLIYFGKKFFCYPSCNFPGFDSLSSCFYKFILLVELFFIHQTEALMRKQRLPFEARRTGCVYGADEYVHWKKYSDFITELKRLK